MAEAKPETTMIEELDISHIITEDDEPVDNIFSEKQQRLLTEALNSSWQPGRLFEVFANVGVFYALHKPPIVPDVFLSMDVQVAEDIWEKKNRSYLVWEFGKPPEVAVEIVSNRKGGETGKKLRIYEQARVSHYIIFDPQRLILNDELRVYELTGRGYIPKVDRQLSKMSLGVTLWEGVYEGRHDRWLRWCDQAGNLIMTGAESIAWEKKRALQMETRAERLVQQLRALGIEPEMGNA